MSELTMLPGSASAPADAELLGILSHELRTPLTILTGMHDLLTELAADRLTPEQREYLATIGTTIDHLGKVVEDVLDTSALRTHMPALQRQALACEPLIADVMALHRTRASTLGVGLVPRVPVPLPAICADEGRVTQVLSRLVANALSFAREGSDVTVHATSTRSAVLFAVEDFGPGIREDDLERLFKPYSQLDMSNTRSHGGLGVGLFLCKRWIEAHGGHIGVVSTHGRGSTFWFTLPCGKVA